MTNLNMTTMTTFLTKMTHNYDDFRLNEILAGRGDPFEDTDRGQHRLLKMVKRFTQNGESFDDSTYWSPLNEERAAYPDIMNTRSEDI